MTPVPEHERVERPLRALPALVAVHRVVAADDRRDPVGGQLGEIVERRVRRDVAAVGERVDPRVRSGAMREQRPQVVDVRVHAAVRDEPEQVHAAAAGERRLERRVLERASRRRPRWFTRIRSW